MNDQLIFNTLKNEFPDFKCNLQDLRAPTEDFVINFYSFWLAEFGVDVKNVNQVQFAQGNIVQNHQDVYSGLIAKTNLLVSMRYFDVVPDFGMLDLVAPTPKRTQNIIGRLLEFFNWADLRVAQIQEKKKELFDRKTELAKVVKEKEAWREDLNNITKSIATIQNDKLKVEAEILMFKEKSQDLKDEKLQAKTLTDQCSEQLKAKEAELLKIKKEESIVSDKLKEYSTLVVDSPSSILSNMESLRVKCREASELEDQKKEMLEVKLQECKKMESTVAKLQHHLLELKNLLKLIDQHGELERQKTGIGSEMSCLQEELQELKLELLAVTSKKKAKQEALQALFLKWSTLKPKLTENLQAVVKELNDKKKLKSTMVSNIEEDSVVKKNIDALVSEIKLLCEDFQKEHDLLRQERDKLLANCTGAAKARMEELVQAVEEKYKE